MSKRFALRLGSRLHSVDSRRVPLFHFDVLVIGSRAAGAAAALAAAECGAEVALLTKGALEDTNTIWAQGGMAAVLGPDDSFAEHVADTLSVGCALAEGAYLGRYDFQLCKSEAKKKHLILHLQT